MADIEIVIKIDEDIYKARQHWVANPKRMVDEVDIAIANGTLLPKDHGRLIDADLLKNKFLEMGCYDNNPCYGAEIIDRLKPIIEADKE